MNRSADALNKGAKSIEAFGAFGFITQSAQVIRLIFPANVARNVTSFTVQKLFGAIRIPAGGYVKNVDTDFTPYVTNKFFRSGQIVIELTNSSGWGVTNNTPVVFTGELGITLI